MTGIGIDFNDAVFTITNHSKKVSEYDQEIPQPTFVLSGHLKIDKTKVLMEKGSLMKAESIAECFPLNILQYV